MVLYENYYTVLQIQLDGGGIFIIWFKVYKNYENFN